MDVKRYIYWRSPIPLTNMWKAWTKGRRWVGTNDIFGSLEQRGDWTIILFKHQGWQQPVELRTAIPVPETGQYFC